MALIETLRNAQDGQAMATLARQFGITPAEAAAVVSSIIPEISRTLERTTLSRGGLSDFVAAMADAEPRRAVDSAAALTAPATRTTGIGLLEQILGNKDQSRAVAGRAAQATGLPESVVKSMLPYVVTMIVGALSKQLSGGLGDVLSKLPRKSERSGKAASVNAPAATAASPLPMPDGPPSSIGGNPYGELSEAIRRRGTRVEGASLGRTVRDILGNALGFRSRGLIGWIIQFIVLRYGASILRMILGGLFRTR